MKQYTSIRQICYFLFMLFLLAFGEARRGLYAQLPVCSGPGSGIIYFTKVNGDTIFNYDPSQPASATNPSVNTIHLPAGASLQAQLAVSENLNAASPSPTFYTIMHNSTNNQNYYYYYDGANWVNTGHTAGPSFVSGHYFSLGAGGGYIYSSNSWLDDDTVWKYDGSGNASILFSDILDGNALIGDIAVDCEGNFYQLSQEGAYFDEYDPGGNLINSWGLTLGPSSGSDGPGGLAIIGDSVYIAQTRNFYSAYISGGNLVISANIYNTSISTEPIANFGTCPQAIVVAHTSPDTVFHCPGAAADTLYGSGQGTLTWSVLNGPATLNGNGDTITVSTTGNAAVVLSSSYTDCPIHADTVTILSLQAHAGSANSAVCAGDSLHLQANGQPGTAYSWHGPANYTSIAQDTFRANMALNDSGYYVVTENYDNCNSTDSVHVAVQALPAAPVASSNSPVCVGDSLKLNATLTATAQSWQWAGPNTFSSALQNTFRAATVFADSGNYTVTATIGVCKASDTIHVLIKPVPGLPIATSNGPICLDSNLELGIGNLQVGVNYQWTGPFTYTAGIANPVRTNVILSDSGKYIVKAILNGCPSAADTIDVIINAPLIPTVSITSPSIIAGHTDTFTAHVVNCSNPLYQWYINGGAIPGATGNPFPATLFNGNTISVSVHCSGCVSPDSVGSNVLTTGIPPSPLKGEFSVWPNPFNDELTIEIVGQATNPAVGGSFGLKIFDIVGREVYSDMVSENKITISTKDLSAGTYILRLSGSDGTVMIRKIIK